MFIGEREVHEYQIEISKLTGDAGKLFAWHAYHRSKVFRLILLQHYTTAMEHQARQLGKSHS